MQDWLDGETPRAVAVGGAPCSDTTATAEPPLISLVIPAYNEAAMLPRLLISVEIARSFIRAPASLEVIVADNGSTDDTAAIAAAHGAQVVPVEKRCIAAARNGGAAFARGEILAFVDADMVVNAQSFAGIVECMQDPRVLGGATGVRLDRLSPGIALTFGMMLPMIWLTGFDTGVVFCRRSDFLHIGGYDETRLFAEDVDFLWRLTRLGKLRGAKLIRLRHAKAIASTRKFDRYGDWHYFTQMPSLAWRAWRSPGSVSDWARRYWYEDR